MHNQPKQWLILSLKSSILLQLKSLFRYFWKAQNQHGLHSPFVYGLYNDILQKDTQISDFQPIESLRTSLLRSRETLQITDYGAGSKVNAATQREVCDVAKHSKKSARLGRLFYRLIQHFGYEYTFDLGTSLGLTTLYLSKANPQGQVTTFEGCPNTARVAQRNFDTLNATNVQLIVGNLDETLGVQVAAVPRLDFVFFDANHRYEPTLRYFQTCLPKAHAQSLFVFDDIHWSAEMEAAWRSIQVHPDVSVTIDLWAVGLVFFRSQQAKQDFILRWPFWR